MKFVSVSVIRSILPHCRDTGPDCPSVYRVPKSIHTVQCCPLRKKTIEKPTIANLISNDTQRLMAITPNAEHTLVCAIPDK